MSTNGDLDASKMLKPSFFEAPTTTVARRLLGYKLVRQVGDKIVSGMVVETEAYCGQQDSACHAFRSKTPRNAVMFGPAGVSYIYLIYGLHHMLNVVTEQEGNPCAVLFRAIEPLEGQPFMKNQRQCSGLQLTNGPGKLCQALAINRNLNQRPLTTGQTLWLEPYLNYVDDSIACGPRVGIDYATLEDQQKPWRFWIKNNPYISKG